MAEVLDKPPPPIPSKNEAERGILLEAGVCMRVPFSRVRISHPKKSSIPNPQDHIDFAGVSIRISDQSDGWPNMYDVYVWKEAYIPMLTGN